MNKSNARTNNQSEYKSRMINLINQKASNPPIARKRGNSLNQSKDRRFELEEQVPLSSIITQIPQNTPITNNERMFSVSPHRMMIDKILPPKNFIYQNKKTLILDLDETLVHSDCVPKLQSDIILPVKFDQKVCHIHVVVRPGVSEFLYRMSKLFEIVIFTASIEIYASPLLDLLDPNGYCKYRLYRDHCTKVNTVYVKDLKRLNRDLKDVIIVDNSPGAYAFNPENGFPILSWFDNKHDQELGYISPILEFLATVEDVRMFIPRMVDNNMLNKEKAALIMSTFRPKSTMESHKTSEVSKIKKRIVSNDRKSHKHSESKNMTNDSKEININIVTNNYLNCFFNNNNQAKEAQSVKNINMFRNTKIVTATNTPNDAQTTKNSMNYKPEKKKSPFMQHIPKKPQKMYNYSSLLDYLPSTQLIQQQQNQHAHAQQQIQQQRQNSKPNNQRPMTSNHNKLNQENNYNGIQKGLYRSPTQISILPSSTKPDVTKSLRPSSSYSNLYQINVFQNNSITPGNRIARPKSSRINFAQPFLPKTPSISSYNKLSASSSIDSIFKKGISTTKNIDQGYHYINGTNVGNKKLLIV